MQTIDVRDLPDPVARAIEAMVQAVRGQLGTQPNSRVRVQLPTRAGSVIGRLGREEIYGDHLDHKTGDEPG